MKRLYIILSVLLCAISTDAQIRSTLSIKSLTNYSDTSLKNKIPPAPIPPSRVNNYVQGWIQDSLYERIRQDSISYWVTFTKWTDTTSVLATQAYVNNHSGANYSATKPIVITGQVISADTGRAVAQLPTGGDLNKVRDSITAIDVKYADTSSMLGGYLRKNGSNGQIPIQGMASVGWYNPVGVVTMNNTGTFSFNSLYGLTNNGVDSTVIQKKMTASGVASISGNNITVSQATTSTNGYLSSTDWNTFNNKVSATNLYTSLTDTGNTRTFGNVNISGTGKIITFQQNSGNYLQLGTSTNTMYVGAGSAQGYLSSDASVKTLIWNTSGQATFPANGVASTAILNLTGTVYTGGTGTTTLPYMYFNQGVTAPTTWSTNGTLLGMNAPSGFTGNFLDFYINGASAAGAGTSFFQVGVFPGTQTTVYSQNNYFNIKADHKLILTANSSDYIQLNSAPTWSNNFVLIGPSFVNNGYSLDIRGTNGVYNAGALTNIGRFTLPTAPTASANYGLVSLGDAAFDGTTAGKFVGSSNGTVLGVNITGSADFLNLQKSGTSYYKIDNGGGVLSLGNIQLSSASAYLYISNPTQGSITFNGVTNYVGIKGLNVNSHSAVSLSQGAGLTLGTQILTAVDDGTVFVGGTTYNTSAIFQITSTTKGFLPPVMTTTQMNAITSPAQGLQVVNSSLDNPAYYNTTNANWGLYDILNLRVFNANATVTMTTADNIMVNNGATITFNLPQTSTLLKGKKVTVKSIGGGASTVHPYSGDQIDGGGDVSIYSPSTKTFTTDGAGSWYLIGN